MLLGDIVVSFRLDPVPVFEAECSFLMLLIIIELLFDITVYLGIEFVLLAISLIV